MCGGSAKKGAKTLSKEADLPTKGKIRFVPSDVDKRAGKILRKERGDEKFDNVWQKGPSRTAGQAFEWNVQLSQEVKIC